MDAPFDMAQRAHAWVTQFFPKGLRCPLCQHDVLVVESSVLAPAVINGIPSKTEALVVVPFACQRCQHVLFFQAAPMGITLRPQDADTAGPA